MPAVNVILLVAGLGLLVKGSDLFVMASSSIAKKLGVSEFVIGLTLVSVGTSVPELASSLAASFQGASGIVIGNVVGSNIANVGLIVGTAALLSRVKTEELMLKRDGYIMFFASAVFYIFALDFRISRLEASIFLLLYVAYVFFLLDKVQKHEEEIYFKDFLNYFFKFEYLFDLKAKIETGIKGRIEINRTCKKEEKAKPRPGAKIENKGQELEIEPEIEIKTCGNGSLYRDFIKLLASGAAIIIGARYFVDQSIFFARLLEIPETLIGMSLVAVGTSLPELMVTVSAARSGFANIALGNAIGSNITNIFLILGCAGLAYPLPITEMVVYFITPFMLLISLMLLLFIWTGWEIKRFEGLFLILIYAGFMFLVFHIS
ncbi:Sodium/calcium exchanger protein [Methanosarcina sp. MTP4]|uniref:calcium/sodium antiporter n=1 Tax=Methanosarcina sp. MTP4 TaxID=1434100 RepID=UPI000615C81D|nr:calcium/sodium antiporter [Methanosarcina sp. MTP4]AKB25540.1 Sodium/calcium exchanger protein [Methanosarcina sp. MTP4]